MRCRADTEVEGGEEQAEIGDVVGKADMGWRTATPVLPRGKNHGGDIRVGSEFGFDRGANVGPVQPAEAGP